jgi:hypothetical protein
MTTQHMSDLDQNVQRALLELQAIISARWPNATFVVTRGQDDPEAIHLDTTVDVDDTEEVLDLVIDRVLDLQINRGIPVHVIPLQSSERIHKEQQSLRHPGSPSATAAVTP